MHKTANVRVAKPRMMLDRYLREAAEVLAARQMELGQRIRKARKDKLWKQKDLAAAVHVEPITVSRWERGEHTPALETLEVVARETGKPVSFFLDPPPSEEAAHQEQLREVRAEVAELRGYIVQLLRAQGLEPEPLREADAVH